MVKGQKKKSAPSVGSALPLVGGRRIYCTNAMFERRCLIYLNWEQRKIAPDNGLVALLCDAVRLVREYNDMMQPEG